MGWIRYSLAWHSNNALTLAHKNTNWLIWMWSMNKKKSNWIYKNIGRDLVIPASPVTSASIIAVAVGGVLLLLLIIDFICCLTLNIGMIATMCRRNKSPPSEIDEETKIGRWVMEILLFSLCICYWNWKSRFASSLKLHFHLKFPSICLSILKFHSLQFPYHIFLCVNFVFSSKDIDIILFTSFVEHLFIISKSFSHELNQNLSRS